MRIGVLEPLLLSCMALFAGCAHAPLNSTPEQAQLQQAIDAAGGEAALTRARVLIWSGEADVFATADTKIELGVESRIEPFRSARSDTWLRAQGRSTLRRMEIDGDQGWLTRDGKRTSMPAEMLRHEQRQYAVYGLMRLVTLREPGVRMRRLPADANGLRGLHVEHPAAPAADMYFTSDGRLAYLTDRVPDVDGTGAVDQRFDFDGSIDGSGVHWPRTLRITQNGRPYFELRLSRFEPTP